MTAEGVKVTFYVDFLLITIDLFRWKVYGHHPRTKLHLHAKFQLWIFSIFSPIAWRNIFITQSPTGPDAHQLAHLVLREPQLPLRTKPRLTDRQRAMRNTATMGRRHQDMRRCQIQLVNCITSTWWMTWRCGPWSQRSGKSVVVRCS